MAVNFVVLFLSCSFLSKSERVFSFHFHFLSSQSLLLPSGRMLSGARRVSRHLHNPFHIAPTPPAKYTAKIIFTMKQMWSLIGFIIRTSVSRDVFNTRILDGYDNFFRQRSLNLHCVYPWSVSFQPLPPCDPALLRLSNGD